MELSAKITGIKYKPYLCKDLPIYSHDNLKEAFENNASFIIDFGIKRQLAVSWWVSAKRTRSYPYSRVYNTLNFQGKKVTVIPIYKDEGLDGDRDFLQWDTISLMSLLGVYVIIGYYVDAVKNSGYNTKITNQRFDYNFLYKNMKELLAYQSDSLHWNIMQIDKVPEISGKGLESYNKLSKKLKVAMHSAQSAAKRVAELQKGKNSFMELSRELSKQAQYREGLTTQPKEKVSGTKARVTIKNYLGGYYYFTSDEVEFDSKVIKLIECKHSKNAVLPSIDDIKDGLIKMVLFSNLLEVTLNNSVYPHKAVLKLTSDIHLSKDKLKNQKGDLISTLEKEAKENRFFVKILCS